MIGARGVRGLRQRAEHAVGGRAGLRPVLALGCVLGLDGADKANVSTVAGQIGEVFDVGYTEIGLLVSAVALTGAICTLPVGFLTDRVRRTRLLAASVALWGVATFVSGLAPSYLWLLGSRAALGAVSATAGPTVASLVGDFFPARERARMYGYVLSGELIGSGLGFAVSGALGSTLGWRYAFWWPVVPTAVLVWALFRLREPVRGGQARLAADGIADSGGDSGGGGDGGSRRDGSNRRDGGVGRDGGDVDPVEREVARAGVGPDERMVLRTDPRRLPLWRTVLYALRIRSNLILIVASSLGYFFFSGLRAFANLFTTQHYGVSTSVSSLLVLLLGAGALVGVLGGGRFADRLLKRGLLRSRVLVATGCLLLVPPLLAPALHLTSLAVALPLLFCGAAVLGASNPPLDAARLDIVPPTLWGTAEGVRTLVRTLCEAAAPTLFGYVAAQVFPGGDRLEYTLLLFLAPLLVAGLLGVLALRSYPRDVATADASAAELTGGGTGGGGAAAG